MQFPFFAILFLVFLVLKLTGAIAWSWLWVTAPLWAGFAVFVVICVIGLLAVAFGSTVNRR